ncbi:MAG: hypothetical protein JXA06_11330 [Bacteroidetes bacterium]|nr:hypothetical protein [Bacteroidota bacterium]
MNIPPALNRMHLEQALKPEDIRTLSIIRIALIFGAVFYLLVVILLYSIGNPDNQNNPDTEFLDILSIIHLVIAFILITTAFLLSKLVLSKGRLFQQSAAQTSEQLALQAVNLYRTSTLLLIAPIEMAAWFGITFCLIGVTNGTIALYPIYWLNTISTLLLVLIGMATFPTRERALAAMETAFV